MTEFDKNLRKVLLFLFRSTRTEEDIYLYSKFEQCNTSLSDCIDYCIQNSLVIFKTEEEHPNSFEISGLSKEGFGKLKALEKSKHQKTNA